MSIASIVPTSRREDDLTQQSSQDSYDIYESPYSEYSDCEYCEARRKRQHCEYKQNTTGNLSQFPNSPCFSHRGGMDTLERVPLLGSPSTRGPLVESPATNYVYKSTASSTSDSLGPGELSSNEIISSHKKRMASNSKPEQKKQSSLITIFSVWNTIMGSSLLTMAWGVERAGLPAALLLFAAMAAVCLYTAHVLLRVSYHHGTSSCEVPALCRRLLGRPAEVIAHAFSFVVLLGANVVYWILITNFLYFTVNYFTDLNSSNGTVYNETVVCPKHGGLNGSLLIPEGKDDAPYWGLHTTVPVYVAVIVFPLLNFKDVSFFTKFNSLGTLSVAYLLIFVVVKGVLWGVNVPTKVETHAAKDAAALSGMLALSFYIHNIIITIMSNNAKQENNARDLRIAFVLVTATYTLVGAVFYLCFPLAKSCIEDNLLNNFEMHDVMTAVARVVLLFQVVTVYPLVAFMLRSEAVLLLPFKDTTCLTVTINGVIVAVCIFVACFCPSIGTIIRYTGAVSGLVHIFAIPSLLQLRSLHLRGQLTCWKGALYCCIMLFGAVNLLMQFFIDE